MGKYELVVICGLCDKTINLTPFSNLSELHLYFYPKMIFMGKNELVMICGLCDNYN